MHSNAYIKSSIQLHGNSFGLKQLSITAGIKNFHYYSTGVQSHFKVIKTICMCRYAFLSDEYI